MLKYGRESPAEYQLSFNHAWLQKKSWNFMLPMLKRVLEIKAALKNIDKPELYEADESMLKELGF